MYVLSGQLKGLPVISLQTGQTVAWLAQPIINPDNLEIMAFSCNIPRERRPKAVLMTRDLRQVGDAGVVIDSYEEIEEADEIVRLQKILERKFYPIGVSVVNESGVRLGRIDDYTVNMDTYMVQKLYVKQPLFKSIMVDNLVIDRDQIVDVTNKRITVRDANVKQPLLASVAPPMSPK